MRDCLIAVILFQFNSASNWGNIQNQRCILLLVFDVLDFVNKIRMYDGKTS